MWILAKQLHTLDSVQDTEALNLGLEESSRLCAQSLFVRSKPSPLRTWSQKWKRDSWTQFLYGRILKPSLGKAFETEWTSLLEVIPANPFQQQASDSDETTQDTSGLGSQMELFPCDPESAFLKTSKDTSALDLERLSANWKTLVIKRRGEYSQRVKLGPLINANGSSSWPTANARDWKDSINGTHPPSRPNLSEQTLGQAVSVAHGQAVPVSPSTDGSRLESWATATVSTGAHRQKDGSMTPKLDRQVKAWATPSTMDHINVIRKPEERTPAANKGGCKNLREEVHQWATPNTMDHMKCRSAEGVIKIATGARKGRSMPSNLREQVDPQTVDIYQKTKEDSWATPRAGATDNSRPNNKGGIPLGDQARRAEQWATPRLGGEEKAETRLARGKDIGLHGQVGAMTNSAKLNPRWVETLMGLPIGWTMPSCIAPVTIAPTNYDCLETESSQPLQPELF